MRTKATFLLYVFFQTILFAGHAQTNQRSQIIDTLQSLAMRYHNASYLSFDVKYKYSAEATPTKIIDSIGGSFKMSRNTYWYKLDSTESISNDTVIVTVFHNDKTIYIANASVVQSANPLAMIDSVISDNQFTSCTLTTSKTGQVITIVFSPGFPYKKIQYQIDGKTGFITTMVAQVRSDQFNDPSSRAAFGQAVVYGILQVDFTNYRTTGASALDFNPIKYLSKLGQVYLPASTYAGYQIVDSRPKQ